MTAEQLVAQYSKAASEQSSGTSDLVITGPAIAGQEDVLKQGKKMCLTKVH